MLVVCAAPLSEKRTCLGCARVTQMYVGELCHFASARSAFYESLLYQVRFVDLLYGSRIFAQCSGYGAQSYRTTLEFSDYGVEYLVVYLIQPVAVYV